MGPKSHDDDDDDDDNDDDNNDWYITHLEPVILTINVNGELCSLLEYHLPFSFFFSPFTTEHRISNNYCLLEAWIKMEYNICATFMSL